VALGESCGPAVIEITGYLWLSQENFQVPPGYVGVTFEQYSGAFVPEPSVSGGPLGHFLFTAGNSVDQQVPPYCSPSQMASPVQVHGSAATLYQCSNRGTSPFESQGVLGHELLAWDDGGITTEVSFHGHSQLNVDLDIAVANTTELVSPVKG
jgi:hypothetical protein